MSQTSLPPQRKRLRFALAAVIGCVTVCVVAILSYWLLHKPQDGGQPDDLPAAMEANNRGVGAMEQFNYSQAVMDFEEVLRLAPGWQPGKINLGIALLNSGNTNPPDLDRAAATFADVLRDDPNNPYANHCLGILNQYKQYQSAGDYFRKVTEVDPNDPHAWCYRAQATPNQPRLQLDYFQSAVRLSPTLGMAVYGLAQVYSQLDRDDDAKRLQDEFQALREAEWETQSRIRYGEMGKYATVIDTRSEPDTVKPGVGPLPAFQPEKQFKVELAPGARWAKAADFGTGVVADLRRAVRERFGATIVVLDYDRDSKPDLFLAGAVVENGQVRDLLLHNEGNGVFKDVTAAAGLATPHPTLGCTVGDFDNDGHPDLLLTGAGSQRLFRNTGKGGFEDVTQQAGFDKLTGVCLGAAFVDIDQDGDLDLLIAEYASTPDEALKALKGAQSQGGGLIVYLNVGVAPAVPPSENQPPLDCRWKRATDLPALQGDGAVVGVLLSDLDGDGALDFLVLADRLQPAVVVNERLLRFRRAVLPPVERRPTWHGALAIDVDQKGRSDALLLEHGRSPVLLVNRSRIEQKDPAKWFEAIAVQSPPLVQAVTVDVDLDGWPDVVGLSDERRPVLLHNEAGKLVEHPGAFGPDDGWPKDLVAVTTVAPTIGPPAADAMACSGFPDLLVWSEAQGLLLFSNKGNTNRGLLVELNGQVRTFPPGDRGRCHADGVGTWVVAQAGSHRTGLENVTLSAGLGQSRQPLVLGLGSHAKTDVVRLRWPDNVIQAELGLPCGTAKIVENNRKVLSCPILFAWNGERFEFVADFLGAGSMGELGFDGSTRPPRPEESVKIEPGQLAVKDGHYLLRLAEPMDEVTYLDRLQLVVVDHPPTVRVFPDERFVAAGPQPSQDLIAFSQEVYPVAARDHRGRDVTETLRARDRKTVDGFAKRAWIGFAEEHCVELDFGDRLKGVRPGERVFLCLAGWTEYPYPESIFAAEQAGVPMLPPVLERRGTDGQWEKVADAGFPAGLPRMMLLDVTGKLTGPDCRLRLRTNLQIFWDQIFVAVRCHAVVTDSTAARHGTTPQATARATVLDVADARLEACGLLKEFSPDGKPPTQFDPERTEDVPLVGLTGQLTKYGDVTDLLRRRDDCFVLFGANDLLTARFDARKLPELPNGWQRSFVLRTWGYCKDTSPFTAKSSTIGPLPFAGMSNYPYGPDEHYPDDAGHRAYLETYNTRAVRTATFPLRGR